MYMAHLQTAFFFLNLPTDWISAATLTISTALANAQVRSFQFPNIVRCNDMVRILRFSPIRGEFGQLAYMSYIFSLLVPSDTIQLVRAFSSDPIAEYKKQDTNALIGVRKHHNTPLLVNKFAFRKNIRNGCILKRPFICYGLNKSMTRAWCPIHAVWPYIQKRDKPGSRIPPPPTIYGI